MTRIEHGAANGVAGVRRILRARKALPAALVHGSAAEVLGAYIATKAKERQREEDMAYAEKHVRIVRGGS